MSSATTDTLHMNSAIHPLLQESSTVQAENYKTDIKIDEDAGTEATAHAQLTDLPVVQSSDRLDALESDNIPVFPAEKQGGAQTNGTADQPRSLSMHTAGHTVPQDQENEKSKKGSSHTGKGADFFLVKIWQHLLFNPDCQHIITWGENGRFLIIYDTEELMTEIKAKGVCKQKDYDSFARQLRIYRWGRVRADEAGSNPWPESAKVWKHPYLTKDSDLNEVANVTRNAPPKPNRSGTNVHKKDDSGAAAVQYQQEMGAAGHTGGSASESDVNVRTARGGVAASASSQTSKKPAVAQQAKKTASTVQQASNANRAQTAQNGQRMSGPPPVRQPPPQILHVKALSDEGLMRGLAQQASALIGIDLLSPALLTYLVGKRKEKMERRTRRAQKRQALASKGSSGTANGMEIDLTEEESRKRKASSIASRERKRARRHTGSLAEDNGSSEGEDARLSSHSRPPVPPPFTANWQARLTCNRARAPSRYPYESEPHSDSEESAGEKNEDASTDDDEEFIPEFLPELPAPPRPAQPPRKVAEENGTETEIVRLVERQLSTAARSQPSQEVAAVPIAPATQPTSTATTATAVSIPKEGELAGSAGQDTVNGRHPDTAEMQEISVQSKASVEGGGTGTSGEKTVQQGAAQTRPSLDADRGVEHSVLPSIHKETGKTDIEGSASDGGTNAVDDQTASANVAGTGNSVQATTEQQRQPAEQPTTSEPPSASIFSIDLPPFPFSFETMDLTPLPFDSMPSNPGDSPMSDFFANSGSLSRINNPQTGKDQPSALAQEAGVSERRSSPPLPAATTFDGALDHEAMKAALSGPAVPSISMQNAFRRQDSSIGSNGHVGAGSTSVPATENANPFDGLEGIDTSAWLDFGNPKTEIAEEARRE